MNERQRTQYLNHMGIDVFVPRWVLPAARVSEQAQLPTGVAQERTAISDSPAVEAADISLGGRDVQQRSRPPEKTSDHAVSSIIDELSAKTRIAAERQQPPEHKGVAPPVESRRGESVAFSLSIWRVAERCWILDSRATKEALPTQGLLNNILLAKSWRLADMKPEILNWPMFDGPGYSGGWDAAREMVRAFLQARLEQYPVEYLWLMGEDAFAAIVGDIDGFASTLGDSVCPPGMNLKAVVLPSLADMLKQPDSKRVTWHAIREL